MKFFPVFVFSFLVAVASCKGDLKPVAKKPRDNFNPTPDQLERRKRSEDFCKSKGIPVYAGPLYLVGSIDSVTLRTKDEVVDRTLALSFMGLKSEGLTEAELKDYIAQYKINPKFSPKEKAYAKLKEPSQQQTVDANWRYESMHVMLWALGFIDSLAYPDQLCVVADDMKLIFDLSEEQFRQKAVLRSKKEILDQADLILRIHWACVDARVKNAAPPANLNASVVYERHYALNWLIKYLDQDWDEVGTDT